MDKEFNLKQSMDNMKVIRTNLRTVVNTKGESESRIESNGLTDLEGAKSVARNLFDTYDRDRSSDIDKVEVVPMISDLYKAFNRQYNPSRQDIDTYFKVVDDNSDGKINYQDIENMCIKYLVYSGNPKRLHDTFISSNRAINSSRIFNTNPVIFENSSQNERKEKAKKASRYTAEIEEKLDVARKLFKQIDINKVTNNFFFFFEGKIFKYL